MSRSRRPDRWRGVLRLALAGAVAACSPAPTPTASPPPIEPTSPPSAASSAPALAFAACPDEVSVVMVIVPTCGYMVVPEDHDRPGGAAIRVLVIRIEPPGGIEAPDPMVVVGETLGASVEYGGFAAHAQRTGRLVYIVDRRGTGLSEPVLDCPEVREASQGSLAIGARDPVAETRLLDAIAACRARLTSAGIDLTAYGLRQSARDVESLRIVLGHEAWNVIAFGSASRLAIEVAQQDPDGVRTVVMDSPVLPQGPDPMFATSATKHSIEQVQSACSGEPTCRDAHPDVPKALEEAVEQLDAAPAVIQVARSDGTGPVDVLVDGLRFARAARSVLAEDGGATIDELLDSIKAAREGRLTAMYAVVRTMARDDALCLGYVPDCRRIVTGSLLTTACGDVLPAVEQKEVLAAAVDVPAMTGVFEANPFFAACDVWSVPPEPGLTEPVAPPPVLAMVGQFDPFTEPAQALVAAAGLENAVVLEVPSHSYNVFGFNECPRLVRRAWLDSPDRLPDTSCFAELRTVDLSR